MLTSDMASTLLRTLQSTLHSNYNRYQDVFMLTSDMASTSRRKVVSSVQLDTRTHLMATSAPCHVPRYVVPNAPLPSSAPSVTCRAEVWVHTFTALGAHETGAAPSVTRSTMMLIPYCQGCSAARHMMVVQRVQRLDQEKMPPRVFIPTVARPAYALPHLA